MRVLQGCGGAMMVPVGRMLVVSRANPYESDEGDRVPGLACAHRTGPRAAARRSDHNLRELALAVSDQRSARHLRAIMAATDRASTAAARPGPAGQARGCAHLQRRWLG